MVMVGVVMVGVVMVGVVMVGVVGVPNNRTKESPRRAGRVSGRAGGYAMRIIDDNSG